MYPQFAETTYPFESPWPSSTLPKKTRAATKVLRETIYDPSENDGYAVLDTRRTSYRHEIWLEETGHQRLWLFGDFSCLLVQIHGLDARAHPVVLTLKRKHNNTTLTFKRRHKDTLPQLWIAQPGDLTKSHAVHIGMSSWPETINDIRRDARAFIQTYPFFALPTQWTDTPLFSWQRPRLTHQDQSILQNKINLANLAIAKHLRMPFPKADVVFSTLKDGQPTGLTLTPRKPGAFPQWEQAMTRFLTHPILGNPKTHVNYQQGGKFAQTFSLTTPSQVDFSAHDHMSILRSALSCLERIPA